MTEPPHHVVELRDVHLAFPEKKVLEGVSLKVEPLDRLVIMGQSGSGKSTILRLILGILQPTAGERYRNFAAARATRRCCAPSTFTVLTASDLFGPTTTVAVVGSVRRA